MGAQWGVDSEFVLAAAFADGASTQLADGARDDIEGALRSSHASALDRWKGITLDPSAFAAELGKRASAPTVEGITALHVADMALAVACGAGCGVALRAFDEEFLVGLGSMLSRLGPSEELVDEVRQRLRTRLFVATERPAKISSYAGRGPLAGWLKVVATREALALLDTDQRRSARVDVQLLSEAVHDPELERIRVHYLEEFRAAFGVAVAGLDDRDRKVLRHHHVERLSIDQIAEIHAVHRATAARWLVAIREKLFDATRRTLSEKLALGPEEFQSVLGLLGSQLDATVTPHLRTKNPDAG